LRRGCTTELNEEIGHHQPGDPENTNQSFCPVRFAGALTITSVAQFLEFEGQSSAAREGKFSTKYEQSGQVNMHHVPLALCEAYLNKGLQILSNGEEY